MISLLAGIGLGSILAAIIGWFVAISNHRQAWINALRDDIAIYLKDLEVMHHAIRNLLAPESSIDLATREKQKRDARISLLFVHRRILLRLNRKESLHIELAKKLDEFLKVETRVPDTALVDELVDVAREILKREWEVTKLGPLAKPIMWLRDRRGAGSH
jgi:hypothetical protein